MDTNHPKKMTTKTIKVYPEIISIVIDGDNVLSVTQEYNDIDKVTTHLQSCIQMVRNYDAQGYYNLAKPEFVDDVITTFSNLELSKKDVIRVNNFINIVGFPECNRIWQLPDEMKVQASQMLQGFHITYDTKHWEDLSVAHINSRN